MPKQPTFTVERRRKQKKWHRFGQLIRRKREEAGIGLRRFAEAVAGADDVKMSATYLSLIENGGVGPPGERTLRVIATKLGVDHEWLLGKAGKIPKDVKDIIFKNPVAWNELLRKARRLQEDDIRRLAQRL